MAPRFNASMPELTRRGHADPRYPDCWFVFYGDVRVGTISIRPGTATTIEPWGWSCGFYPGSQPGECAMGTAATFEDARAGFDRAWAVFLSNRTDADFQEQREAEAWTVWKHKMWDTRHQLPTQTTSGRSTCFCGDTITIGGMGEHVRSAHMDLT